jgi:hypothetical protein
MDLIWWHNAVFDLTYKVLPTLLIFLLLLLMALALIFTVDKNEPIPRPALVPLSIVTGGLIVLFGVACFYFYIRKFQTPPDDKNACSGEELATKHPRHGGNNRMGDCHCSCSCWQQRPANDLNAHVHELDAGNSRYPQDTLLGEPKARSQVTTSRNKDQNTTPLRPSGDCSERIRNPACPPPQPSIAAASIHHAPSLGEHGLMHVYSRVMSPSNAPSTTLAVISQLTPKSSQQSLELEAVENLAVESCAVHKLYLTKARTKDYGQTGEVGFRSVALSTGEERGESRQ